MQSNEETGRLITGTRDLHLQVWQLETSYELKHKFNIRLDFVPRCIAICNGKQDVYVFALYNGLW
jgi:hypothetical protein